MALGHLPEVRESRTRHLHRLLLPPSRQIVDSIRILPRTQVGYLSPLGRMTFCGIQINPAEQAAIASFALMAASELIGMSKLRENSLIQLVLGLLKDESISRLFLLQSLV